MARELVVIVRAIGALCLRDLRKFLRQRTRLITGLAQPLMYLVALGAGFGAIFEDAGRGNYFRFLLPGVVMMAVMTGAFVSGISVLWDRKFGFIKETLVAPVPRFWVVAGRAIGAATTSVIQGGLVLLAAVLFGNAIELTALPTVVGMMFLVGLFFASAGIFCGALLEDAQGVQLIVSLVLMPLFFFSGALFPVADASGHPLFNLAVLLNPMAYGVDGLRAALDAGGGHFGLPIDGAVLAGWTLLSLTVGGRAFSRIEVV